MTNVMIQRTLVQLFVTVGTFSYRFGIDEFFVVDIVFQLYNRKGLVQMFFF